MRRPVDILCAGELLVDLVTAEFVQTAEEATLFKRIPGGNPALLAMNMARLGNKAMLAACVGNDDMGAVLLRHVSRVGVDVSCVSQIEEATTLMMYTRAAEGANLQPYRGADMMLSIRQFPFSKFEEIAVLHVSCFALSKNPAQHVIIEAAEKAKRVGCRISLEINYSEKIWPDRREAQRLVAELCRLGAMVHVQPAGWTALYESEAPTPTDLVAHFQKMGANEILFNLGAGACFVADDHSAHTLEAPKLNLKQSGDLGELFWAAYLTARLDGKSIEESATAARRMAEIRSEYPANLPDQIDRNVLYEV